MQLTYPVYHDNGEVSFCTDEDEPRKEYRKTALVGVAAFTFGMADRHYGGPEEGGWWYTTGQLVRVIHHEKNEDRAYAYARRINSRLKSRGFGPNKDRREISSVLSEGEFWAEVHPC